MRIEAYDATDTGKKRDHNEDFVLVREDIRLFVMCDGMGGHAAGEVAAEKAARTVEAAIAARRRDIEGFDGSKASRDAITELVRRAIEDASREVYRYATGEKGRAGMGTTLTMMVVVGDKGFMGHVGDSRLYLCRRNKLHQLSEDHSYTAEMVKRGMLSKERARDNPYANMITRAVGIQASVQVDTLTFDVVAGDTFLLCSDGLHRYFEENEDELAEALSPDEVAPIPKKLVDIANERGGRDNVSCIVVRAERDDATSADDLARSTEVNLRLETLRHVTLFRHLTMKELVLLLEVLRVETCSPGEVVIQEGDKGRSLYVILDGEIAVARNGRDLAKLVAGEHFGEMSLLSSRPRSATVRSLDFARLLVMDYPAFEELLRVHSALGVKLLWTIGQVLALRLDNANDTPEPPPL